MNPFWQIQNFNNQPFVVRQILSEVAWILSASDLMLDTKDELLTDASWCQKLYQNILNSKSLQKELLLVMPKLLSERARARRLGRYYELVLSFLIALHFREGLFHSIQIVDQGRTLGELDFLIDTGQGYEHWEVCLKYYCRFGIGDQMRHWRGPNGIDRLDIKWQKLIARQLAVPENQEAISVLQKMGLRVSRSRLFVRGILFHPIHPGTFSVPYPVHPNHQAEKYWIDGDMDCTDLPLEPGQRLFAPHRTQWLSTVFCESEGKDPKAMDQELRQWFLKNTEARQVMVAQKGPNQDYHEVARYFVLSRDTTREEQG
ncbi:MAG: DUF1853 family protein [Candidatus Cloacimonetes bacterium]|nr:DUF1853 family protein [Candidatus Cloacimonadota bacterium]